MEEDFVKEDTLRLIRRVYKMVKNDDCPSVEALHAGLLAMCGNETLNKTEAAKYLGIAVSTFNKYIASGAIPCGEKKRNECLKWKVSDLDKVKDKMI